MLNTSWFKVGLLVLSVVLSASMVLATEITRVNEETGEIEVVKLTPVKRLITPAEQEAITTPGKEVPVDLTQTSSRHEGFWWLRPVETYSRVVVFDGINNKLEWRAEEGLVLIQREFAKYKIFLLIAIMSMILSNLLWQNRKRYFICIFALLATFASLIAFTTVRGDFTALSIAILFTASAALVTAYAGYPTIGPPKKVKQICYSIYSILFYLAGVVALFV